MTCKEFRILTGFTTAELADWLGVSRRTVEGWECNSEKKGTPPLAQAFFERLAEEMDKNGKIE